MPPVSTFSLASFLGLVLLLAFFFILGLRRAGGAAEAPTLTWLWTRMGLIVVTLWLGISALVAQVGLLSKFAVVPPPILVFVGLTTLLTTWLAFSNIGLRFVNGVSIAWLVGFQAFRVPLELLLHRLYQEQVVPVQMTFAGRNYDIVTGLLAALFFIWAKAGRLPRWAVLMFNLIGLVLLFNIVGTAILSMPTPLRRFHNEPANTWVAYFPYVWLPAFLVQAAWFGHLLVFRWLSRVRANF